MRMRPCARTSYRAARRTPLPACRCARVLPFLNTYKGPAAGWLASKPANTSVCVSYSGVLLSSPLSGGEVKMLSF